MVLASRPARAVAAVEAPVPELTGAAGVEVRAADAASKAPTVSARMPNPHGSRLAFGGRLVHEAYARALGGLVRPAALSRILSECPVTCHVKGLWPGRTSESGPCARLLETC